ncbi:TraR/DksA C4-type zinc finger protein [Paenibacillus puerhi]|uniref:TraR/DksA C4-type zinc finger protein n=1 Tax=Paenibacillus puerhi TaxID=2692622 RepID=UPI00135B5031|nr:TraR/DksA C4-type zinc finger protein [Paenibacillus puerhi]
MSPVPSRPNHLTDMQLGELSAQLREEGRWLEAHISEDQHKGLENSMRDQTGELSAYDNHPADLGSEMFERGKDIALLENAERHLSDVQAALSRMENGKYGSCLACGQPIPFERLQALPTASYCMEHVLDPNESERRPVEEKLLAPPFGRTSLDERTEQNRFDGEDAWQIVESWGTSNTPAMAENPNVSSTYDQMEIEADEHDGYVESFESFVATDLYGQHVSIVRNRAYRDYIQSGEGDSLLESENMLEDDYDPTR